MWRGSAFVLFLLGCARTFHGEATQPNPVAQPVDTLRTSERITIVTGDMELYAPYVNPSTRGEAAPIVNGRWPLVNQASFTVVSRDRLRFHVQIDHKWQEWADLNKWQVSLVDDRGRHWLPEEVDHARVRMITRMWDVEQQNVICDVDSRGVPQVNPNGDCLAPQRNGPVADPESGYLHPQTLGSLSVFRGKADFVFYERDLFTPEVRWLKLTLKHGELSFEFVWRFEDNVATVE